jgi:hypothetical protein
MLLDSLPKCDRSLLKLRLLELKPRLPGSLLKLEAARSLKPRLLKPRLLARC